MGQVATPAQFRVTMDVPHSFAVEPGFLRDQHCHDMRPAPNGLVNTWQDPVTGLIMLRPSFLTEAFYGGANWHPLTDWVHDAAYWQQVFGNVNLGANTAGFFSTVLASGVSGGLIPQLTGISIAALSIASSLSNDTLHWVLQSSFSVPVDGGFVFHYHAIADEKHQYKNWFALQFDDLGLQFSYDGTVSFYQYGTDKTVAPTMLDQTVIATPGDIAGKAGYFIVIPVPGQGLNIYHSLTAQRLDSRVSSAVSGVTKGYQFRLTRTDTATGRGYVHKGGTMSVAVGAAINLAQHKFGYHAVTYPTGTNCGSFTDSPVDLGYQPTHVPEADSQGVLLSSLTGDGAVNINVLNATTGAAWAPTSDVAHPVQQAQVQLAITNNDADHTPFVISWYLHWQAIFNTRATTPVMPDRLFALEFTDDDLGHFEGSVTTMAVSDAYRAICERGDTTFLLEKSLDGGTTWVTHNGGIAQVDGAVEVYLDSAGIAYVARWTLTGKEFCFREATHAIFAAYDGLTPGGAINKTLEACSEPIVTSVPADLTTVVLPTATEGQNFRFTPRLGESGDEIIRDMLLVCRKQYKEYRCRYDWANSQWLIDLKPRDTSAGATWTFTPYPDELDLVNRKVMMATGEGRSLFSFTPTPPEGNTIRAFGASSPEPQGALIPGTTFINLDSIGTKTSPDYLGRVKIVSALFAPISDVPTVNLMGRRMYDAIAHRRLQTPIIGREYIDTLTPGKQIYIRIENAAGTRGYFGSPAATFATPTGLWLKRRTVSLQYNEGAGEQAPTVTYTADSVWESDLQ